MMLRCGLAQDVPRWVNSTNASSRPNWFLIFPSWGQRVKKGKTLLTVRLRIYSQFHHLSNLKSFKFYCKLISYKQTLRVYILWWFFFNLMIANEISITYPLSISVEESSLRQKTIMADYMTQMLNTLTIRIPLDTLDWW